MVSMVHQTVRVFQRNVCIKEGSFRHKINIMDKKIYGLTYMESELGINNT